MSLQSVKITYELNPPAGVQHPALPAKQTHEFTKVGSDKNGYREYYAALQKSIHQAKDVLGVELTSWRDAVGKAELSKEPKKTQEDDEDEDDEVEET